MVSPLTIWEQRVYSLSESCYSESGVTCRPGGEEKVKIVSSQVDVSEGRITIDGRDVFADLLAPAELQQAAKRLEPLTSALPDDDTKPGHVRPAMIVTIAGSA